MNHPGYQMLNSQGKIFIGGPVKLNENIKNLFSRYDLTPRKVKEKIAFNLSTLRDFRQEMFLIVHLVHILELALKEVNGLFIQPLIGKKKRGDFTPPSYHE